MTCADRSIMRKIRSLFGGRPLVAPTKSGVEFVRIIRLKSVHKDDVKIICKCAHFMRPVRYLRVGATIGRPPFIDFTSQIKAQYAPFFRGFAQTSRPASGRARLAARVRGSAAVIRNQSCRRNPPPIPVRAACLRQTAPDAGLRTCLKSHVSQRILCAI